MKGSAEDIIFDFFCLNFPRIDVALLEELAQQLLQLLEEHGHINDSSGG